MATKKQIILPIAVLVGGIALAAGFSSMKQPPEEKPEQDTRPLVSADVLNLDAITLDVKSYGVVKAKDHTQLVAQVSGQVVFVSEQFVQGGFVSQGDILARIDPNDYEAALIEAQAGLAQASSDLEIERAQAHVAKAEWDRIKDDSNQVIPSNLYLRKPQLAEKLARYRAAQAAEKRAVRNLERTYIKAPYDAIIAARDISLGSVVNPGSQFGSLSSTSIAEIRLPVADKELQYLENGGIGAMATLTAEFAGKPTTWQAKIVRSEGVIDQKSRMSYLVAQVNTPYQSKQPLRFGSYINATITGQTLANAIVVPHHLVKDGKIAVLNDDLTLSFKTLNIVREQNGMVIANEGLNQGEQLITSALEFPTEGMQVKLNDLVSPKGATQLALKEE
ncbi:MULTISPECIES: efflux RND transporter periplasmic adaptor subunit [unclassified Pseudoalteromonas]|uniref:efflux RND transporter periplasmic adaptor subunit n=1 Tax=unclassified Pseudoalteromonas TaxID=194690 RepID=UPI0007322A0A|nr:MULTISPECIES: efflux RND transporter periplasmic adaptor subunit [unclassified Pseudoalteromonas]KTF17996.1 RND transporter [Pseudoalteromonas sp. H105]MDP2635992.1 efflux RND transporter periplasmic adaptor subunit [Pseudoalteromonas sp. 1_MG-2023]PHN89938.1 efflux RND transporter periplasmic adaptor subunit [Pseudoalteromonas sp. 3D05]